MFLQQSSGDGYVDIGNFPCPDCGKIYTWRTSLTRHRREECGKEPQFQCPYCTKKTKLKCNLRKHIKNCHPTAMM
ncbi:hypothetical protein C0J52_13333 [Blattella germanica]|nr:hypothetical protein C0J52_13333 [Blattella germanica]